MYNERDKPNLHLYETAADINLALSQFSLRTNTTATNIALESLV